jgi:hypothetical protein
MPSGELLRFAKPCAKAGLQRRLLEPSLYLRRMHPVQGLLGALFKHHRQVGGHMVSKLE